ncbi:MAG: S24 family peptidase [Bacteroidales bacterium]
MQENKQEKSLIKQNILTYLEKHGISQYEFHKLTGITRGILGQNNGISEENVMKFLAYYTDVNIEWLLTGKGQMIKSKGITYSDYNDEPKLAVGEKDSTNEYQIIDRPRNIKMLSNKSHGRIIERQEVPLYNVSAAAGIMDLFHGNHSNIPSETIVIPRAPRCDGAIYVLGDSMYPLLKSGDIVMYSEITDIQMYLVWGEMYIVAFGNEGDEPCIVVKYVHPGPSPDLVTLVSQNQHHAPKEIPLKAIRALARVNASIRFQTL